MFKFNCIQVDTIIFETNSTHPNVASLAYRLFPATNKVQIVYQVEFTSVL